MFKNLVSRKHEKTNETEGGSFGSGHAWRLSTVTLTESQMRELDALFEDMRKFTSR